MQKSNFNLASLVVIVVLLGLLTAVLFPAVSSSKQRANMAAVAARGRDIYVPITSANTDREPLGLPAVWPQSNLPTTNAVDISQMNFTNSTDYFWALYDGDHLGTTNHNPYIKGFDFSKLAGAGVKVHTGQGRLKPENNMWTIAKNVRDDMDDVIPILVTRNLAAESLSSDVPDAGLFRDGRRLLFDQQWDTPFGENGVVLIRKGGGTYNLRAKYVTPRVFYNSNAFHMTPPDSKSPRIRYLTPTKEVIPSEAVYQACAASNANRQKEHGYNWMKSLVKNGNAILKCVLILVLISGIFIFFKVLGDKKLSTHLPIMVMALWLALWLAVTLYVCVFR
jgi:type II secretory pathway pseudopilin PulG